MIQSPPSPSAFIPFYSPFAHSPCWSPRLIFLLFPESTKLVATTGPLHLLLSLPGTHAPKNYHMACSLTLFGILLQWTSSKKISLPCILLFPSFSNSIPYLIFFLDNIYLFHKLYIAYFLLSLLEYRHFGRRNLIHLVHYYIPNTHNNTKHMGRYSILLKERMN